MKISREYIRTNSEECLVTHPEEFLVTHSGEFHKTHSKEFLVNRLNWGPIPGNILRISEESFTRTCSLEITRKFFKASHQNWRSWGNFSLLLPGYKARLELSGKICGTLVARGRECTPPQCVIPTTQMCFAACYVSFFFLF